MLNKNKLNLTTLDAKLRPYLFTGYDLYFIHGWFCAYLCAPSGSEEDLLIPSYLIVDEDKIKDEGEFVRLVDSLLLLYNELAAAIYEKNKPLRPLIDLQQPAFFDAARFNADHLRNLLNWLYGYLTGYLAIGEDITEYAAGNKLVEEKFYPALFTLCVALKRLARSVNLEFMGAQLAQDFAELQSDLTEMWESEDEGDSVDSLFAKALEFELDYADIAIALNDIFYVVRVIDEAHLAEQSPAPPLLKTLVTKH